MMEDLKYMKNEYDLKSRTVINAMNLTLFNERIIKINNITHDIRKFQNDIHFDKNSFIKEAKIFTDEADLLIK